jgi:ABC-type multidrug transport system ATPase subunit
MYLILGPPASGKSSLLKAVAGRLSTVNGETMEGTVQYNGLSLQDEKNIYVENVISFVGQLDWHAPRLTVKETFDFAFQCKSGGTHIPKQLVTTDDAKDFVKKLDEADAMPMNIMEFLGLENVANTFVGNSDVRGVSGGQRRRVTVGEMVVSPTPVFCGDEISNGLDAASTFSIVNSLMYFAHLLHRVRVISLLQPSPETVSLFDEIILLSDGQVLYAGPVDDVEDYFGNLGYRAPDSMDVADFLQVLSTPEGGELFDPDESDRDAPYTLVELAQVFRESYEFQRIKDAQTEPWHETWELDKQNDQDASATPLKLKREYANSGLRAMWLNLVRNMIIWSRDKRFLIANSVKNLIMGVSVGGVFFQTTKPVSIYGVLFQLNLFIMLGTFSWGVEVLCHEALFLTL